MHFYSAELIYLQCTSAMFYESGKKFKPIGYTL